ncbi:MAG TPA: dephospho-CoA kinase [Propionicimonas sp.]|jgi:dephospho-CoA kinase|uniref:dephospho-CoA kinase n=1 Tax=Propionicimonas sp. TaxID=1955623 RepID=UPI002F3ECE57
MLVGLTGGIGSGKSLVAELLAAHGATIVDADVLAREVVAQGTPGLAAVADRFGADVLLPDGSLDRQALGRIVFGDAAARRDLEAIIHPAVRARAAALTAAAPDGAVVVQVIPLLVETGQQGNFDQVVVVDVEPEVQLSRIMLRDGLSEPDARARLRAQASRQARLDVADVVLKNNGTPDDLAAAVDRLWAEWEIARA